MDVLFETTYGLKKLVSIRTRFILYKTLSQ